MHRRARYFVMEIFAPNGDVPVAELSQQRGKQTRQRRVNRHRLGGHIVLDALHLVTSNWKTRSFRCTPEIYAVYLRIPVKETVDEWQKETCYWCLPFGDSL